ncbi:hypothetical protein CQW23_15256 [Capsicum baccatum]|uniref:Uncharacterized protein n=1 Tax=Capsicum baccatum TaxID=33114 RepID=A0A2G2WLJ5_CAPBA|nr:hypothetical protein CQW23_15256 [Capsicum baccatum]
MEVISRISTDGTFDQERPLLKLRRGKKNECYSFDLKSATDRWPLSVMYSLMSCMFGSTFASSIVNSSLGLNTFLVGKPITKRMYEIAFLCGQPLGYYGSWTTLGLCTVSNKYPIGISVLQRLYGAGFRVRSRLYSTQSKRWERLKAAAQKPNRSHPLPLEYWIGRGNPLNPYLKGKIVDFL